MDQPPPVSVAAGLNEHPDRRTLNAEIHARPYLPITAPARICQLAYLGGDALVEIDAIGTLCRHFGVTPPADGSGFFTADMGPFQFRWERHTEFSTYRYTQIGPIDHPFRPLAIEAAPMELLAAAPGRLIAAVALAIKPAPDAWAPGKPSLTVEGADRYFAPGATAGIEASGGEAEVYGDFFIDGQGFTRFLVYDRGMRPRQAGRLAQRLVEIETYRAVAMLGFPPARAAGGEVTQFDRRLAQITARMSYEGDVEEDRALLDGLVGLAADVERISAETIFRFGATRAYHALVKRRLEELREERLPGYQPFTEFLSRRLDPAAATCDSAAARLESLSVRVSRASQLLRTRVDMKLERQNRDLLQSMNRRARLQLRLQETVEGLSIAAIGYYIVSLIGYIAKGAKPLGWPFASDMTTAAAAPVVLLAIWFAVRRMRKRLTRDGAKEDALDP